MQLANKGIGVPLILNMLEKPALAKPDLLTHIYQRYRNSEEVCFALRDKGIRQADAIGFNEFQSILKDHSFALESLPTLLDNTPFEQVQSDEDAVRSLQEAAKQLHKKSKAFLIAQKASHNTAAKAGTELYLCLRHQLKQYEIGVVSASQLAENLNAVLPRYKAVLSQHRGYRQLMYDIAQAILCLLGVGIAMTAYTYATTGRLRLFVWKNEAQRIVENAEQAINSFEISS